MVIQYLLTQIGLEEGTNQFLKEVQFIMEKYRIDNYKRLGMGYSQHDVFYVHSRALWAVWMPAG